MPDTVLQERLPFAPWADPRTRRMPGVMPLAADDWLRVDDAYGGQMGLRDRLIAARPGAVHALLPGAEAAARELFAKVVDEELPRLGIRVTGGVARRPDGVAVPVDADRPLITLGRLVQEDLCLMQAGPGGVHRLTGAILCFPAGWTLAEKLGHPLLRIHAPVAKYDEDVGRRVQRLFDAIRPETPLWRANAHYSRAPLFHPLGEGEGKDTGEDAMPLIRSERQCLLRLPVSQAVVFSIHTYLVRIADLTAEQAAALAEHPVHRAR